MENDFKIRAIIYARVSTKEQAEGKASIPEQLEVCKKAIVQHGWELVKEPYIEGGVSGHLLEERIALQNLLADAREHLFDLVVVKDFDRFARNRAAATIVREELKELFIQTYSTTTPVEPKNPKLYDPTDDDLGIMVEGYSDTMAEIERNKIRRRMMMGKVAVAKKGDIPNNVPYGYKIVRWLDDKGKVHRKIEINEEQAKVVKEIFDQYIKGKGALNIAFGLIERKIKAPRGNLWRAQAVKYILMNETYTGKVLWGWRHADYKKNQQRRLREHKGLIEKGNHTAIIDPSIFKLAQKEKKIRGSSQKGRAQMSRGLLTGIAKCMRCGSGVTFVTRHHHRKKKNSNWNDTTTHEYLCGGYKYSGICQRRVMGGDKLDDYVLSQLKNIINNPIIRDKIIFDRNAKLDGDLKDDYSRAIKILAEIPKKREKQEEAYEAGLITMEEYGARLEKLRGEENMYREVTGDYEIQLQQLTERQQEILKYLKDVTDFNDLWDKSTFEERKHLLKNLIKEVRAGNGKVEIDFRF